MNIKIYDGIFWFVRGKILIKWFQYPSIHKCITSIFSRNLTTTDADMLKYFGVKLEALCYFAEVF